MPSDCKNSPGEYYHLKWILIGLKQGRIVSRFYKYMSRLIPPPKHQD